jgi:imidazolonepropionase-like amidohydrolase
VGLGVDRGLIAGPRILAAGHALTITGGHGHSVGFAREVDGPDTLRRAVREEIRAGATAIKLVATGGVLTPGITHDFTAFTQDELDAAVDEAHSWGRVVGAHAIGPEGIIRAVLAGVDSIEHGSMLSAEGARLMKERGAVHVPTISAIRGIVDHADEVPAYAVEKAMALVELAREGFRRGEDRMRDRRRDAVQPARQHAARDRPHGRVGDDATAGDAIGDLERGRPAAARRRRRGG